MSYRNACNICGATSSEWIGPEGDVCMHCSEYVNGIELRERERIIELLIDCHFIRKEGNSYFTGFNGDEDCTDVIELIKGKTK